MSVDKFGRHTIVSKGVRGPKGDGFEYTTDGNFDIQQKKLCNVADATEKNDSVNLNTLKNSVENCMSLINDKITKSNKTIAEDIQYLKTNTLIQLDKKFNANSGIITNLSKPKHTFDAVNYVYLIETLIDLTHVIYQQINKKKKKKSKKEWKEFILKHHHPTKQFDWGDLFSVKDEALDQEHKKPEGKESSEPAQ